MVNKHIITAVGSALLAGGAVYGAVQAPAPDPIILADNVEQHSRLKQPPIWNTSIVSSIEMTKAYTDVAKKYNVSTQDITNAGGNIQLAIQKKMATMLLLCDNANTNKL